MSRGDSLKRGESLLSKGDSLKRGESLLSRGDSLKRGELKMTAEYGHEDYGNMVFTLEEAVRKERFSSLKKITGQRMSFKSNRGK